MKDKLKLITSSIVAICVIILAVLGVSQVDINEITELGFKVLAGVGVLVQAVMTLADKIKSILNIE